MILGPITFERPVIRSIGTKDGWVYSSHDVIEGKPRKQYVARESNDMSLDCYFHAELLNVDQTLAQLRALAEAHEIVTLQSPNGYVWGSFVIAGLEVKPRWLLPDGAIVSADVTISLEDPGTGPELGTIELDAVAVTGTTAATRTTGATEDTSGSVDDVTPEQIARRG